MPRLDDIKPLQSGFLGVIWESVVEEGFDGPLLRIHVRFIIRNEADKSTLKQSIRRQQLCCTMLSRTYCAHHQYLVEQSAIMSDTLYKWCTKS